MRKYDFIFLSVSDDSLPCYSEMRQFAREYFSLYKENVKIFFIELKNDLECDVCEKDDYIYVKGEECITPGMYIKTIKSMEYVNNNYDYDFLIRTNLSSFWNLKNLFTLKKSLPLTNFAGGFIICELFISGTGIILSKDVCINLVNLGIDYHTMYHYNEDVYIGILLEYSLNISLCDINNFNYMLKWCIDGDANVAMNDIENVLYYRIKNDMDRTIDLQIFSTLYKFVYETELDIAGNPGKT